MINNILKIVSSLFLTFISIDYLFGYAHTHLMLENNCSTDATFIITDTNKKTSFEKVVKPYQYYITKELSNDNFLISTTSHYEISYKSQDSYGSVKYELSNAFFYFGEKGANKALFKDAVGNIEVNHRLHNNNYEYYWTNYSVNIETLLNGSLIKPSFTVSACHKEIDIFDSLLFSVKKILIFGDSLSDRGNLYKYSLQLLPKSTPYYRGMFSNGEVWSAQFANRLYLNNISVNNYAVGGSSVIVFPEWANNTTPYVLDDQVSLYLNLASNDDIRDKLAIFFVGGNDYLTSNPKMDNIDNAVKQVTDGIISAIEKVAVKKTVIVGLPDLSITGESKSLKNEKVLKEIYIKHNKILRKYADEHHMKFIDIAPLFSQMVNNTKNFNKKYHANISLKHIKDSCWLGGYFLSEKAKINEAYDDLETKNTYRVKMNELLDQSSMQSIIDASYTGSMCNNPQDYAFWDHVHPTYQVHRALYDYIVKELGARSITKEKLS
ncbi:MULTISPECIES: SGNH/GDSL hydrolase family protein [unclassified Francisella]|uniref:SGNH/GDSL hydrolase family protein n=1 Tax=unclassified Francisella TaxID=2610885 RepID=UPI002E2EE89F|nr:MULTISPECIES: SGNH/GDSL hydrolase family protein [unclassified Francisella]MED7819726.1 SGNH/GDSL hydrolase family protein [Francisella sp. 19S2-4]MED7830555.1 SGNH/GDSL hydrolase family protein [Francisella sp. 19S2-10]